MSRGQPSHNLGRCWQSALTCLDQEPLGVRKEPAFHEDLFVQRSDRFPMSFDGEARHDPDDLPEKGDDGGDVEEDRLGSLLAPPVGCRPTGSAVLRRVGGDALTAVVP